MSKKISWEKNWLEIGKLRIQKMRYVFLWKYINVILHLLFTILYLGIIQDRGEVVFDYLMIPTILLGLSIFLSSYFSSGKMKGVWILSLIAGLIIAVVPIVFIFIPDFNFLIYYVIINLSTALDLMQTIWFTGILLNELRRRTRYILELALFFIFYGLFAYYIYLSYPSYLFNGDVWDNFDPTSLFVVLGILGFFLGAGILIIVLMRRNAKKQGKSFEFPSWSDVGGFFGRKGSSSSSSSGKYDI